MKNSAINAQKIEINAINKLKDELVRYDLVTCDLSENDKTPSFDGTITLYKSTNLKKENMFGIIRVQVKGKTVSPNELNKHKISYTVEVADLKNYYNVAGGVIYFVICMVDFDNYKIYYNCLLPLDLKEILNEVRVNQKNKNITFREFPKNELSTIHILTSFIENSKKQHGRVDGEYEFTQFDEVNFSTVMTNDMFKHPVYIYGRKKGLELDFPITKAIIESMVRNGCNIQIKIINQIYFEKVDIEKGENKLILIFGSFKMDINEETLNFEPKNGLKDIIRDFDFFIRLITQKTITIGENTYKFKDLKILESNLNELKEKLEFYIKLRKFLLKFNIDLEIDVSEIRDHKTLENIIDSVIKKIPIELNFNEEADSKVILTRIVFSNLIIAIKVTKMDDGKYQVEDFFDDNEIHMMDYEGKLIPSCIYIMLKKQDFIELSNINFANIKNAIFAISYSVEYGIAINNLALEMLFAYDETNDAELINCAAEITKWLSEQEDKNSIFILNYLQSIRRTRELSKNEKDKIFSIRSNEPREKCNYSVLTGLSILLENKSDIEYYYEKMEEDDKINFKKFPIYTLAKKICPDLN